MIGKIKDYFSRVGKNRRSKETGFAQNAEKLQRKKPQQ